VVGKGEAVGKPDQAQIQVGVDIVADSVDAAASQNQVVIDKIMAALTAQGVQPDDIQTTNYNVWVEQIYPQGETPQVGGYHVSNQVNVTIHRIRSVVIAAVIDAEPIIFTVTFSVESDFSGSRCPCQGHGRCEAVPLNWLAGRVRWAISLISETIAAWRLVRLMALAEVRGAQHRSVN
jgi:hypothetical protein